MPFCPNCKAEYNAGVAECSDCLVPLVASLPSEESNDGFVCSHCDTEVEGTASHCPYCGFIFDEDVLCPDHPELLALAHCVICDRILCEEDVQENGIHAVCAAHMEVEIVENHVLLVATADEVEADMLEETLQNAGLHPMVYRPDKASGNVFPSAVTQDFQVVIPIPEYLAAVKLAEKAVKQAENPLEDDEA